jgi:hypothetical protein
MPIKARMITNQASTLVKSPNSFSTNDMIELSCGVCGVFVCALSPNAKPPARMAMRATTTKMPSGVFQNDAMTVADLSIAEVICARKKKEIHRSFELIISFLS